MREGVYAYPWPTHVDVWQKPSQCCNYLLTENKNFKKRVTGSSLSSVTLLFQGLLTWLYFVLRVIDGHVCGQWDLAGIPCPAQVAINLAIGPGPAVSVSSVMPLEGLPTDASRKPALGW